MGLILFVFAIVTVLPSEACAQDRPNILLVLTDDQGYGDIGIHGNDLIRTPNMDALSEQGVELTQFIVNPSCTPTRAALMTGRDSYRTGVADVQGVAHLMGPDEKTIAELLSDAGYRTGIFGKWHLGDNYPMRATDQGFQEALVHKGGGVGQTAGPPGNTYFDPILDHNDEPKRYEGYVDDILAEATMEFMEESAGEPFFAYFSTPLPHFPLDVPDERAEPYRQMGLHELNARTYGMIENVDSNLGRMLEKLDELGLRENTIVIFMSDNGPRTRRTKNDRYPDRYVAGLRGTKSSIYENGIRVPFLIRWPEEIPAGVKSAEMAAHYDLLPTLLDAAGVQTTGDLELDGISLLSHLRGETATLPDRAVMIQGHRGMTHLPYVHMAVRTKQYKLISPHDDPYNQNISDYRSPADWRNMLSSLELYDIQEDPSEIRNLASSRPDIVEDLLTRYEDWYAGVTADHRNVDKRVRIGTPHQPVVEFSRFDPNREKGHHWWVHAEEGTYRMTLQFPAASQDGEAVLRFGSISHTLPIEQGDEQVTFEGIRLPGETGYLEASLNYERLPVIPHFVQVERTGE
ncbi:MAG: arylsulfatase [Bacteroidota bacterium]